MHVSSAGLAGVAVVAPLHAEGRRRRVPLAEHVGRAVAVVPVPNRARVAARCRCDSWHSRCGRCRRCRRRARRGRRWPAGRRGRSCSRPPRPSHRGCGSCPDWSACRCRPCRCSRRRPGSPGARQPVHVASESRARRADVGVAVGVRGTIGVRRSTSPSWPWQVAQATPWASSGGCRRSAERWADPSRPRHGSRRTRRCPPPSTRGWSARGSTDSRRCWWRRCRCRPPRCRPRRTRRPGR